MKDLNLNLLHTIVGGVTDGIGCKCWCLDVDNHSFSMGCAPNVDYCEYLCKVMLFSTINVKSCSGECDASSFYGIYPDALKWMENKTNKTENNINQEL